MTTLSANIARQLKRVRDLVGTDVEFGGITYRAVTEEVAGAKAGTQNLPHTALGAFAASEDPRLFVFSPQEFKPWTTVAPPQEGDYLTWHNLLWLLTAISYEDVGDGTTQLLCYGYRKVS